MNIMKTQKLFSRFLALSIIALTLFACDTTKLEDAIDDFAPVIALEPINTSGAVLVVDAVTGELVTSNLQITFTGTNGNDVIDLYSDPLSEVTINGGVLNFGVDNNVNPSPENPAEITLNLSANGYLSTSRTIRVEETGNSEFRLSMVRVNNTPPGIEIVEESAGSTDASGATTEDVTISVTSTDVETQEETSAAVEVPSGSVFLDASGTPLNGELRSEVVFYNPSDPGAVSAVPEALLVNEADTILSLVAAADLSVTDESGRVATSLQGQSGKLGANGEIQNDGSYILNFVLNGATYRELQQLLRLAFISPTTAERVILYSVPQVNELPNGRVSLRYALNSEVFRSAALVYFSEQPCDNSLTINRNGNEGTLPVRITERGFFRSADLVAGRNVLQLRNITRGTKNVRVTLPFQNYEETIDICGTTNPTISLPTPPSTLIDATVNVTLECANPEERVRVTGIPAATVLYRKANAPAGTAWRVARNLDFNYNPNTQSLTGGTCSIFQVEQGEEYDLKITYDNTEESASVTITGTTVQYTQEIDDDVCR